MSLDASVLKELTVVREHEVSRSIPIEVLTENDSELFFGDECGSEDQSKLPHASKVPDKCFE